MRVITEGAVIRGMCSGSRPVDGQALQRVSFLRLALAVLRIQSVRPCSARIFSASECDVAAVLSWSQSDDASKVSGCQGLPWVTAWKRRPLEQVSGQERVAGHRLGHCFGPAFVGGAGRRFVAMCRRMADLAVVRSGSTRTSSAAPSQAHCASSPTGRRPIGRRSPRTGTAGTPWPQRLLLGHNETGALALREGAPELR